MSNCLDVSSEQLCYIPCNFCSIVLAVSVPCSSLLDIVTVRCGHCGNLWSVNMAAAAFHSLTSSTWQPLQAANYGNSSPMSSTTSSSTARFFNNNNNNNNKIVRPTPMTPPPMPHPPVTIPTTHSIHEERVVNRPPEKRQRVPSAYNQFIKEEIQRIKASNPDISHREAFSTAAKNWAHFPHIHFGLMLENNHHQAKVLNEARSTALLNN